LRKSEKTLGMRTRNLPEQFPDPILLDILILVETTFPPLSMATRMLFLDTLMGTSGHQSAKTTPSVGLGVAVNDILQHWVIQKETVHRTIAACHEVLLEPSLVEATDTGFTSVPRA
jgi:hypothetical protein